jgi:UDP-2,3-diacylglucosamine pyrophosphatase LpxH
MPGTDSRSVKIVHIADLPSSGNEGRLIGFVDEMAFVKPDAVLVSGDLAYEGNEAWFVFLEAQFARLERMGIRVIAISGNHDYAARVQWLRHFGPIGNHREDVGPLAIIGLDSAHGRDHLTPSQFLWLKVQLDSLGTRTPIIMIHHPIFPPGAAIHGDGEKSGETINGFQKEFVRLCHEKKVPIVLSGHWHQDAVFDEEGQLRDDTVDFPGTKYVVTTSLGDSVRRITRWPHRYFGYRILEFQDGKLSSFTYDLEGKGRINPMASVPLGTYVENRP